MKPIKEQTEVRRLGLYIGLFKPKDIVAWVDKLIEEADIPDNALVDISLFGESKGINFIISKFEEVKGVYSKHEPTKVIVQMLYKSLVEDSSNNNAEKISRMMFNLTSIDEVLSEDIKQRLYGIDDEFSLTFRGIYGTVENVIKEMKELLEEIERGLIREG